MDAQDITASTAVIDFEALLNDAQFRADLQAAAKPDARFERIECDDGHVVFRPYVAASNGERRFASDVRHDDPGRVLHWAESGKYGIKTKWWKRRNGSYAEFHKLHLSEHKKQRQKDGDAFFPGGLSGDRCVSENVEHIDFAVPDIDATDEAEVLAVFEAINAAGLGCDIYSTYNNGVPYTEIKFDLYHAFCQQHGLDPSSQEAPRCYLVEVEGYRPDVVKDAYVKNDCAQSQEGLGTVVVLGHAPVIKLRFVFTLDRSYSPVEMVKQGFSNEDARGRLWVAAQRTLFEALGIPFDGATTDVARRFYAAARRADAKTFSIARIQGKAVRLDAILPKTTAELDAVIPPKGKEKKKPEFAHAQRTTQGATKDDTYTFQGFKLKVWAAQYAKTFKIVELFTARGLVLDQRNDGGYFVRCWQEDRHTSPNPPRTYAVNGDGEKGFILHCAGGTDGCCDLDRLQRLKGYLEAGLITLDDLQNPEFGGGPSLKATRDSIREKIELLTTKSTSDDWTPIIDDLARLGDGAFDAEALDLIATKTDRKIKTILGDALKKRRAKLAWERQQEARANAETDAQSASGAGVKPFFNWDREPFNVVAGRAKDHLVAENNKDPRLFVRGTSIVRAATDTNTGARQITVCGEREVRAEMERVTTWSKMAPNHAAEGPGDKDFIPKFSPVPDTIAQHFCATEAANLSLPYLRDVVDTPYFNKNGELIVEDGYDPESGILLTLDKRLKIDPVSADPTEDEIAEARWWLQELYSDFPFSDGENVDLSRWKNDRDYRMSIGKSSRTNQIAKTIQPFVAETIHGNLMLHLVTKVMRRTGAGYMQDGEGIVAFGSTPAVETLPNNEEEVQKRILTKAMEGIKHVVFDNQKEGRIVQSESIASAQTAGRVCGRILGQNRTGSGPWRATVEINGNNLTVHEDIAHRGLWVALDAHMKSPEARTGFAHDPYQQWVSANRGKFIWAILTIVQAWIARGRPETKNAKSVVGGFEAYCRTMGGILEVAGIAGFNANRERIRIDAAQVDEMEAFLGYMLEVFGTREVSVGRSDSACEADPQRFDLYAEQTLVELLLDLSGDLTLGLFENPNKASLGSRLGKKLGTVVGRPFDLKVKDGDGETHKSFKLTSRLISGATKYRLEPMDQQEVEPRTGSRKLRT